MVVSERADGSTLITEAYNGVTFKTNSDETLAVCMRDSGFEISYEGVKYYLQNGYLNKIT